MHGGRGRLCAGLHRRGWTNPQKPIASRPTSMARTKTTTLETPSALGYRMPAEWERHEATWLGWPHLASDWPGKMNAIRWVYGEMIRKIGAGETVRLCVNSPAEERAA